MSELLHQLIDNSARAHPERPCLQHKQTTFTYAELKDEIRQIAAGLTGTGLARHERVAVYLPKQPETVTAFFATSAAGGVIVPVNPVLKAQQVCHILTDCNARVLITTQSRYQNLEESLAGCHDIDHVIIVGPHDKKGQAKTHYQIHHWASFHPSTSDFVPPATIDTDMAAILYTSGSTGKPKGVVLSHRNMVAGAKSVASYLNNTPEDKLLAVLPFSFDYGFSQMTTAFLVGACVVLIEYLLPRDVIKAVDNFHITGLAAVPPLWVQLADLDWPENPQRALRYITNSGGAMPVTTLEKLRKLLPQTQVVLMYGLTEAFRSTYLAPEHLDSHPKSMGKAIPNAEVMVVREDGSPCAPGEPGELVHRGSLVAMGYWNDPDKTAERFRPAPGKPHGITTEELAVWSGDTVTTDEHGFLYFVGRKDEMIKTSGYRVSPTEVEEVIYRSGYVSEAVALGIAHPTLGQAILVVATAKPNEPLDSEAILAVCKKELPNYMIPASIEQFDAALPRNPNGKIDRKRLSEQFATLYQTL